jgi:hypothetical protein
MINFGIISDIISQNFDIDLIDIKRNGIEIYSNIPCNIQINTADNPDTTAIDVVPIVTSLTIHMNQYVDIQNNDYIVAKRMSNDRQILEVYTGVCGFPSVWQSRKSVNMAMATLASTDDVTPPPPADEAKIIVQFKDELGNEIKPDLTKLVEAGSKTVIYPTLIEGFEIENAYLDGVLQENDIVEIQEVLKEGHKVTYIYKSSNEIDGLRILSKGIYTKDDGEIAYGYHLYKKIPILEISGEKGNYEIVTPIDSILHDDNGVLKLQKGTIIKLFNSNEWARITENPVKISNEYKFITEPYTPLENEAKAYETNWYGV